MDARRLLRLVAWSPFLFASVDVGILALSGDGLVPCGSSALPTFVGAAESAGVDYVGDTYGPAWGDFGRDGDLDLCAGSHLEPSRLGRNSGDGTFIEAAGIGGVLGITRGGGWVAEWADYDSDGFLDLFVQHRSRLWALASGGHQLLRNQGNSNHWLKLELVGDASNHDGLGAKVRVTAGGKTQFGEKRDQSSHCGHHDGLLHVGMGAETAVDEVFVWWTSGATTTLTDLPVDTLPTVFESGEPLPSLYVGTDGDDSNDCTSRSRACRTLQRAVDVAVEGDTIRVATGVYTDSDTARLGYVLALTKTVSLQGGYDAVFSDPPDPMANPTTVDAQGLGRALYIVGGFGPTVEGLHITGGNASGLGGGRNGEDIGGGVCVISATATIRNNWVFSNTAELGGGCFLSASTATLTGNTVVSNTAAFGGGGLLLVRSPAILTGNSVMLNAAGFGGGLLLQGSGAKLSNNTVITNSADMLGGGLLVENSAAIVTENRIAYNTSGVGGGGLFLTRAETTVRDNTIVSNSARFGGGLQVIQSAAALIGNTISSNTAWRKGGGLYLGSSSGAILTGNTVTSNTAESGGGLLLRASDTMLSANTIKDNAASDSGGGLHLRENSNAELVNNIIAENGAGLAGSGLFVTGSRPRLLHTTIARNAGGSSSGLYVEGGSGGNPSIVTLTNSIVVSHTVGISVTSSNTVTLEATVWGSAIWANERPWEGLGTIVSTRNFEGNPAFVDPGAGNYHIGFDSVAVDAGVDIGVSTDIDGQWRPLGRGYDIGADECHPRRLYLPLLRKAVLGLD